MPPSVKTAVKKTSQILIFCFTAKFAAMFTKPFVSDSKYKVSFTLMPCNILGLIFGYETKPFICFKIKQPLHIDIYERKL